MTISITTGQSYHLILEQAHIERASALQAHYKLPTRAALLRFLLHRAAQELAADIEQLPADIEQLPAVVTLAEQLEQLDDQEQLPNTIEQMTQDGALLELLDDNGVLEQLEDAAVDFAFNPKEKTTKKRELSLLVARLLVYLCALTGYANTCKVWREALRVTVWYELPSELWRALYLALSESIPHPLIT